MYFFFNDTATTEIYTLSLHDALPILQRERPRQVASHQRHLGEVVQGDHDAPLVAQFPLYREGLLRELQPPRDVDRKSTRLNSSHANISYAVFCLKKKNSTSSTVVLPV